MSTIYSRPYSYNTIAGDGNFEALSEIKSFVREFKEALKLKQTGWHSDISKWQRLFPNGILTSVDGICLAFMSFILCSGGTVKTLHSRFVRMGMSSGSDFYYTCSNIVRMKLQLACYRARIS